MLKQIAIVLAVTVMVVGGIFSNAFADGATTSSLIVKLVNGLSLDQQAAAITRNGGVETSSIPALRLHVVEVSTSDLSTIIAHYQADPQVERVEVNKTRQAEGTPSDPFYPNQWSLPTIGWDAVFGAITPIGSATVAVLDTGVDASHPDLTGHVIPGTSILDGSNGMSDPHGHGTWLSGIVAALTDNSAGIAGIGYMGVQILPVTVLAADGTGRDSDVIAGVLWAADHGADVILMGFSNAGFSQNLQDAIDYAWSKGAVLVAATGNGGVSTLTFPAGDRSVMGVSATDQTKYLAPISNYGQDVFMAAPGMDIYTTDLNGHYTVIAGTSGSAAIVAGVAAFMKAADPALTNGIIVGRLSRTTDPSGTQDQTGNGIVNMARALADTSIIPIQPAGAPPVGDGGPFAGPYVAASHVENVTFSGSPLTAGATATWTIGFTTEHGLAAGGTITVNFDESFGMPATPTVSLPNGFTSCSASATGTNVPPGYATVTITLADSGGPCSLPDHTAATLTIAGITNPPAGHYEHGKFRVRTSEDNGEEHESESDQEIIDQYTLTLTTAGTGSGTTSGAGTYNSGQTATVSASANTGSTFSGWTGPNGAECATGSVLMNANKSCTATFTINTYTLTITTAGTGSGTTSGAGTYNYNQTATVSATANAGSTFAGWSGPDGAACGTGSVLMTSNKSCTATFTIITTTYTLTINTAGGGSGTVSGGGTYNYGQIATVTATANAGSFFTGWTGPDAAECGTGSVLMNANKSCTANFKVPGPPSDTTADLVLCQYNFTSNGTNAGSGSSVNTVGCNLPFGVAIDRSVIPNHVYVSDFNNNRVLGWANEFSLISGAPADIVIGQPGFTSGSCNNGGGTSASTLCTPKGLAVDSAGNLYVADQSNGRILIYFTPFTTNTVADRVIGQPNMTSGGCSNPSSSAASASSLCLPTGVALDGSGNLYVADMSNNRILEYNTPLTMDAVADQVIGQTNFTTETSGLSASGLNQPYAVALDAAGNVYVADFGNNRVLEYNTPLTTDTVADRVFGQANFTSGNANRGSVTTPAANTLANPMGIVVDGTGNVYVVDRSNNRVLEYNTPLTTDTTADRVFGQAGFTTSQCNKGGLGPSSFCLPSSLAIDTLGDVWVVDYGNNRVFEFSH